MTEIGFFIKAVASPPADWSAARKQAYFDWAAQVINGVRGVHPGLEAVFDGLIARQREISASEISG